MKKSIFLLMLFSMILLGNAPAVLAQESAVDKALSGVTAAAENAGLESADTLEGVIGRLLGGLIAFLGLFMLILAVYGGITWMTAGGDPGSVSKAKQIIINGVIGLAICLLAYSFTVYVVSRLGGAVLVE